ncbi:hypothetical protein [Cellulomonas sp.]|uniref:hypothetical protein n=1 Tax=Cellulomonas sp. TaxID=40001 RepID=UPI00258CC561|nr:hypothetical protein [Cellulomonas sp.]MCR6689997.1 hypothetical protein [Cellulomonas sp.]
MCHRTRSVTNPYRVITVSQASVTGNNRAGGGNGSGHSGHTGPVFSSVAGYYATHAKDWGDIIPPFGNYKGLNSTGALPGAPTCRAMSAEEFYNVQREAGVPRSEIITDLQEQGAIGDPAPAELATLVYTASDSTLAAEDGEVQPQPTTEPQPSPTPVPTAEPQPTPTAQPAAAPEPTATPQPTVDP